MLIFNFNTFSSGFHAPPSALTCVHHGNVDEVLSGNSPTTNGSTAKTMVTQAISIVIVIYAPYSPCLEVSEAYITQLLTC